MSPTSRTTQTTLGPRDSDQASVPTASSRRTRALGPRTSSSRGIGRTDTASESTVAENPRSGDAQPKRARVAGASSEGEQVQHTPSAGVPAGEETDAINRSGRRKPTVKAADRNDPDGHQGLRIGDAAARVGVSARTLRYYEELDLLTPSGHTPGGERRYRQEDLARLERILELRSVLGMNLDDIKRFLDSEERLEDLRARYRAKKSLRTSSAREEQRALLLEAIDLNESLAAELDVKLARMSDFRAKVASSAQRCRELLEQLD